MGAIQVMLCCAGESGSLALALELALKEQENKLTPVKHECDITTLR